MAYRLGLGRVDDEGAVRGVITERHIGAEEDGGVATTDLLPLLEAAVLLRIPDVAATLYTRLNCLTDLVKVHGGTQTSVGRHLGGAAALLSSATEKSPPSDMKSPQFGDSESPHRAIESPH